MHAFLSLFSPLLKYMYTLDQIGTVRLELNKLFDEVIVSGIVTVSIVKLCSGIVLVGKRNAPFPRKSQEVRSQW